MSPRNPPSALKGLSTPTLSHTSIASPVHSPPTGIPPRSSHTFVQRAAAKP
jgi:hypothetical protein